MEKTTSGRCEKGIKNPEEIDTGAGKTLYERLNANVPFMARYLAGSFSNVGALPQISNRGREIAGIGARTATGYAPTPLRSPVDAGLSSDGIIASINMMCIVAGFPATTNALSGARDVLMKRGIA